MRELIGQQRTCGGANDEKKYDGVIIQTLSDVVLVLVAKPEKELFGTAPQISRAHGGCYGVSVNNAEAFHLQGAYEGYHGVDNNICFPCGNKGGGKEQRHFQQDDQLPPVNVYVFFQSAFYDFRNHDTQSECGNGYQIMQRI